MGVRGVITVGKIRPGWKGESHRHRLAGMGIKTSKYSIYHQRLFKEEPDFKNLIETLLKIDGDEVESDMLPNYSSSKLLDRAIDFKDRGVLYIPMGDEGGCLDNVLCFSNEDKSFNKWYGFALVDGYWLSHFWITDEKGRIIETTPIKSPFERYWGMKLTGEEFH